MRHFGRTAAAALMLTTALASMKPPTAIHKDDHTILAEPESPASVTTIQADYVDSHPGHGPQRYEPVWIGHPRPALSPGWRFITTAQRARDVAVRRVAKKLGVSRKKVREAVAQ